MILSAIAAMSRNRVIGSQGTLPWNIPEDMQFFKEKTSGHIMLMGRKTFTSLGKPLPKRHHIVVTRQRDFAFPGVDVFNDFNSAIEHCRKMVAKTDNKWGDEVFILGGGEVFSELMPVTNRIYLTEIDADFPGDVEFPQFDKRIFLESSRVHRPDASVPFSIVTYDRA